MITSTFWHIIGWSFGIMSTLGYLIIVIGGSKTTSEERHKAVYFITAVLGWAIVFGIK